MDARPVLDLEQQRRDGRMGRLVDQDRAAGRPASWSSAMARES
jgi:hypothetical protein